MMRIVSDLGTNFFVVVDVEENVVTPDTQLTQSNLTHGSFCLLIQDLGM
jgi:hypothetical protein